MTTTSNCSTFTNDLPSPYDRYEIKDGNEIDLRGFRRRRRRSESQLVNLRPLTDRGAEVETLPKEVELVPSVLSVHIQRLPEAGIVSMKREGKRRIVSIIPSALRIGGEVVAT